MWNWRLFWYALFVVLAAPVDIVLDFWGGFTQPNHALLIRPLANALFYSYAFVIAVEAVYRIAQHGHQIEKRTALQFVVLVCVISIIMFVVDYVAYLRMEILDGQSVFDSWWRQLPATIFALWASFQSFRLIEQTHASIHLPNILFHKKDTKE